MNPLVAGVFAQNMGGVNKQAILHNWQNATGVTPVSPEARHASSLKPKAPTPSPVSVPSTQRPGSNINLITNIGEENMFIFFKVASNVIVWTCRLRITNKKEAKSKKLKKTKQTYFIQYIQEYRLPILGEFTLLIYFHILRTSHFYYEKGNLLVYYSRCIFILRVVAI